MKNCKITCSTYKHLFYNIGEILAAAAIGGETGRIFEEMKARAKGDFEIANAIREMAVSANKGHVFILSTWFDRGKLRYNSDPYCNYCSYIDIKNI